MPEINRKRIIIAVAVVVLGIATGFFLLWERRGIAEGRVCFAQHCFSVELAQTPEEQAKGLMHVTHMGENRGMLFIFPEEGIRAFWMKDTLIPLDMIWLDSNKQVVFIKNKAQPCATEQCEPINHTIPARYVLEINGGLAEKYNIRVGDAASF